MKRRILSLALALVMCLSLLPAAAFAAEKKPINSIVLDSKFPVHGQHPYSEVIVPEDAHYTAEILSWEDVTPGDPTDTTALYRTYFLKPSDTFQAGHSYKIQIKVCPHPGYVLDDPTFEFAGDTSHSSTNKGDGNGYYTPSSFTIAENIEDIPIDARHFPDPNFRLALQATEQGKDGVLTPRDVSDLSVLIYPADELPESQHIHDLTGIAYLSALRRLDVSGHPLTEIDLSRNRYIASVQVDKTKLTHLDLSHASRLNSLSCATDTLETLDVRNSHWLRSLTCGFEYHDLVIETSQGGLADVALLYYDYINPPEGEFHDLVNLTMTDRGYFVYEGECESASFQYGSHTTRLNRYNPLTYTLTFDGNGHTSGQVPAPMQKTTFATTAEFTAPPLDGLKREGYTAESWTARYGDFDKFFAPGDTVYISLYDLQDTLYVHWQTESMAAPVVTVNTNDATGKPYLTWSSVTDAENYEVWFRESGSGDFEKLYTASGTRLNHSSAKVGVTYDYQVRAVSGEVFSPFSETQHITCRCAQPDVKLTIRSDGKPVLTWDKVAGAEKYEVYRSVDGGYFDYLTTVKGTKMTNTSAQPGQTCAYQVRAIASKPSVNSVYSETVAATLPGVYLTAPRLSVSNKRSTGKPYLEWSTVENAECYEVYRATSKNGSFKRLTTRVSPYVTNGTTTVGRTYYYKVRAVAEDGTKGPFSAVKSRTCDCAQPDVKLTVRSDGKPVLTWQKITGAVKYEVYRSDNGEAFTRLATVTGTKLTNSSAKSGHTYRYKVRAIAQKSSARGSWSYYDTVTVK